MQFSTLFLISLFSVSLVLSGCVGSDNDTGSSNSGQSQENGDGAKPDDDKGNEDTGGDNNEDQTPSLPSLPNIPNPNDPDDNGTPSEAVSCEAPDTNVIDSSLGDVGKAEKYDDIYDADKDISDLSGTWVVIGSQSAAGTSLNNPSINIRQKYFLVIKHISGEKYKVANCSGRVIKEDLKVCVDDEKKIVSCETGGREIPNGTDYKKWDGYLNKSIKDNTITLPVSLAGELEFYIETNSYLTNTSQEYYAKKISTDTSELGTLNLENTNQNKITKKVYYKALTAEEIDVYKTGTGYKDIDKLTKENIASYTSFDLPSKTVDSNKHSSEFENKNLSCLSQQVMHTRQCTAKNSETTTDTNTLAAISATSTKFTYHLLFAAEQDADNNLLTVQNLVVKSGKTTEKPDAGTTLTVYDDIGFAKNKTQTAADMKLEFQAETRDANTYSYQTGFKAMCSPTEANFLSNSGGDCDEEDKTIYKTLLETTNTIVERKADVNLEPDPARVK